MQQLASVKEDKPEILIRSLLQADTDFIYSTWLKNYRFSSHFAEPINDKTYYQFHHKVIERILDRALDSKVACLEDSPETILGYLIYEVWQASAVIHYCYVKFPFRQEGVATKLFKELVMPTGPVEFTHLTPGIEFLRKIIPEMNYNPYLL